jgi:hypothetical protein
LAELEETLTVLSDPRALADIREADAAYAAVTSFVESVPFAASLVSDATYELVLTPPAIRAVQSAPPRAQSSGGHRVRHRSAGRGSTPRRQSAPRDLAGIRSARRGTYECCTESTRPSMKSWSFALIIGETCTDLRERLFLAAYMASGSRRPTSRGV